MCYTVETFDRLRSMSKAVIDFNLPFKEDEIRQAASIEWVATTREQDGYDYDVFHLHAWDGHLLASHRVPSTFATSPREVV